MNLVESNKKNDDKKMNKLTIAISSAIVVLLIISIALFFVINQLKEGQFKFIVDNKAATVSKDLFVFEGNDIYVSIKDIAPILDYKYYNGGYKQYSEDTNSCYVEGENEICTFENTSNKIYKTPKDKLDYQLLNIDQPIKMMNDKLYISSKGLRNACNIEFNYDKQQNQVTIYTLPYLTKYYTTGKFVKSGIKDNFNNQKAILYNLLVIQNFDNTDVDKDGKQNNIEKIRYGVSDLNGVEIIGTKYTNIEFIESTKEFIVTTEEGKVGIITETGETKVKPQYDALKQIDKELNLYLATNNNKKGIIEKNGKILIYLEYDEIGIDTSNFENNNIKNSYILYNNAIPVMQNNKWGMYDVKGNQILPLTYDGIGCVSKVNNLNSTVIIPSVEGIVFAKNYEVEDTSDTYSSNKKKTKEITLYGIVNSKGKVDVEAGLESVYFVINNGREEYTMITYQGSKLDLIDYYNTYVYKQSTSTTEKNNTVVNNETNTNTTTNSIVNTNAITNSTNTVTNTVSTKTNTTY